MYESVATVTVSIKETVSLDQGERSPDRDSYFPKMGWTYYPLISKIFRLNTVPSFLLHTGTYLAQIKMKEIGSVNSSLDMHI